MCDSPYQASRSFTANSARASDEPFSVMTGPEIGFAHRRIGRNRLIVALRQNLTTGEHGNAVAEIGDDAEIVLDHQHRTLGGDGFDQRADAIDVFVPHT